MVISQLANSASFLFSFYLLSLLFNLNFCGRSFMMTWVCHVGCFVFMTKEAMVATMGMEKDIFEYFII